MYGGIIPLWGTTVGARSQQVKDMGCTVLLRDEWLTRYRAMNHEALQAHQMTETEMRYLAGKDKTKSVGVIKANGDACHYTVTNEQSRCTKPPLMDSTIRYAN